MMTPTMSALTPTQRIQKDFKRRRSSTKIEHDMQVERKVFFETVNDNAAKMMDQKLQHEKDHDREEMMTEYLKKAYANRSKLTEKEKARVKKYEKILQKKFRKEQEKKYHEMLKKKNMKASQNVIRRQKMVENLLKKQRSKMKIGFSTKSQRFNQKMSVFNKLDTYIRSDKIFENMNALKEDGTVRNKRELEMMNKLKKFETEMKKGLFDNNQLNKTKLLAIKQHVENNKQSLMKKLEFLQSSIVKEELHGGKTDENGEAKKGEESIEDFMERMKSKLDELIKHVKLESLDRETYIFLNFIMLVRRMAKFNKKENEAGGQHLDEILTKDFYSQDLKVNSKPRMLMFLADNITDEEFKQIKQKIAQRDIAYRVNFKQYQNSVEERKRFYNDFKKNAENVTKLISKTSKKIFSKKKKNRIQAFMEAAGNDPKELEKEMQEGGKKNSRSLSKKRKGKIGLTNYVSTRASKVQKSGAMPSVYLNGLQERSVENSKSGFTGYMSKYSDEKETARKLKVSNSLKMFKKLNRSHKKKIRQKFHESATAFSKNSPGPMGRIAFGNTVYLGNNSQLSHKCGKHGSPLNASHQCFSCYAKKNRRVLNLPPITSTHMSMAEEDSLLKNKTKRNFFYKSSDLIENINGYLDTTNKKNDDRVHILKRIDFLEKKFDKLDKSATAQKGGLKDVVKDEILKKKELFCKPDTSYLKKKISALSMKSSMRNKISKGGKKGLHPHHIGPDELVVDYEG